MSNRDLDDRRMARDTRREDAGRAMTGQRLLVVDDEPAFGEFARKVASGLGFAVEITTDGHAFMERYDAFVPTVVMVDMVMPGIEGMELVQWLAEREVRARIILVTGFTPQYAALAKMLAEGRGLDSVATLTKPIKVEVLRRVLTLAGETEEAASKSA
jgi:CheY-like chemotaxis protein